MTVEEYYDKQISPQKEICLRLRELVKRRFPKYRESMLWGVPVFNDGLIYIVALKSHVNLGFTLSNLTNEEESLFQGGGKTTRKIEFAKIEDINEEEILDIFDFLVKKHN